MVAARATDTTPNATTNESAMVDRPITALEGDGCDDRVRIGARADVLPRRHTTVHSDAGSSPDSSLSHARARGVAPGRGAPGIRIERVGKIGAARILHA